MRLRRVKLPAYLILIHPYILTGQHSLMIPNNLCLLQIQRKSVHSPIILQMLADLKSSIKILHNKRCLFLDGFSQLFQNAALYMT